MPRSYDILGLLLPALALVKSSALGEPWNVAVAPKTAGLAAATYGAEAFVTPASSSTYIVRGDTCRCGKVLKVRSTMPDSDSRRCKSVLHALWGNRERDGDWQPLSSSPLSTLPARPWDSNAQSLKDYHRRKRRQSTARMVSSLSSTLDTYAISRRGEQARIRGIATSHRPSSRGWGRSLMPPAGWPRADRHYPPTIPRGEAHSESEEDQPGEERGTDKEGAVADGMADGRVGAVESTTVTDGALSSNHNSRVEEILLRREMTSTKGSSSGRLQVPETTPPRRNVRLGERGREGAQDTNSGGGVTEEAGGQGVRAAAGGHPTAMVGERSGDTEEDMSRNSSGFGSKGWYSPDQVGTQNSLFSWKSDHGDRPTATGTSMSQESGAGEAVGQSQGSPEAKTSEAAMDGWSERRRLLETWDEYDEVWTSMREEAKAAAEKEPLLVSFIHSTILNQKTLEAAVAFHLANKLAGPNMLSTQVQALVLECFSEVGHEFQRQLRRDIIAVRERDPACDSYHDCLLYFKGFQALQTHRVAHWLFNSGRHALAFYLQSQVNQEFQIDIHPGAKFGEGVFIDHGTGIVVGETAVVGNDVSMLHRVTLGGSGVQDEQRHPKIGNGVLIGAGACLLGNISVGKGTQIGAGSLVVEDLPERCVAVGVPAKVLGQGRQRKPALAMGQDFSKEVWHGSDI